MRALIVYESVFGNTHAIAEAVADGLRPAYEVVVVHPEEAGPALIDGVDLLVVGGPTHMHTMATEHTKAQGAHAEELKAEHGDPSHPIEEAAFGESLRDWFRDLAPAMGRAAAFDTRVDGSPILTGRASKAIAKRLRHQGRELVVEPESFLVDKANDLLPGELVRAAGWARTLVPEGS